MKRRFELVEGGSSNFWEIELRGASFLVRYGRIGSEGQTSEKSLATDEKARAEHDKLVAEKTKKGYAEVGAAAATKAASKLTGSAAPPSRTLTIFADYHHFYLCDRDCTAALGDAWDPAAVDDRLAVGDGVIGIGTARNMDVKVDVEVLAAAPADDAADFQHVTECSVPVPSGKLIVNGPTDEAKKAGKSSRGGLRSATGWPLRPRTWWELTPSVIRRRVRQPETAQ